MTCLVDAQSLSVMDKQTFSSTAKKKMNTRVKKFSLRSCTSDETASMTEETFVSLPFTA